MSFLFPLYLLGAAAIAIPILLHLRKRPPKEHIPFSSLMFLEKSPERLTRRTKLEQLLLLALRCLAILLLALAFGRPFLSSGTLVSQGEDITRAVILVDRSASMQREDLWEQALERADKSISSFKSKDEISLAFFDAGSETITDFPVWKDLSARARVAAFREAAPEKPTWMSSNPGGAMTRASDALLSADASSPATHKEVILISDFHEGSDFSSLNDNAWPDDILVRCLPVAPQKADNFSITLAATPPRSDINEEEIYRVRISNAATSESAAVKLGWKGFPETAIETLIAPGISRILPTPPRPPEAERGILEVTGDSHPFDNEVYVAPVQARPLRIKLVRESGLEESAGSPLFYLRRALQSTPALEPIISATESLTEVDLTSNEVIIIADTWSDETGEKLNRFAQEGGLVIAVPSADTESSAFAKLAGNDQWALTESAPRDYSLLSDLDFDHPVLIPFARAKIRDFTKIRFWKHRALTLPAETPDTRIIARFDGESPALIEKRIGTGALFAFMSGWEPSESQLALSSKFVPLLFSIFEHVGYSSRAAATLYVGETKHTAPGFYEVEKNGKPILISVNLAPNESRTTPVDPNIVFTERGIPLAGENDANAPALTEASRLRIESEEKEEKQKLWKWLIVAALIILLIETVIAGGRRPGGRPSGGRRGSRRQTPQAA